METCRCATHSKQSERVYDAHIVFSRLASFITSYHIAQLLTHTYGCKFSPQATVLMLIL